MIVRFFLVSYVLMALTGVAFAGGEYQRTKNGKTMVWNSKPQPGDIVTWSGDRDSEQYATGFGTLIWYTTQPGSKPDVYSVYYGNMVRGKFEGPVNAHVKEKTAHAVFTDGTRTSGWTEGPAPNWKVAQKAPEPVAQEAPAKAETTSRPTPIKSVTAERNAESKREQPARAIKPEPPTETPVSSPAPSPGQAAQNPAGEAPKQKVRAKFDDSLRALVGPPATLRASSAPEAAPQSASPASAAAEPSATVTAEVAATPDPAELTAEEAIDLADAEALGQGYDLGNYLSPKADYSKTKERWSVFYAAKTADTQEGVAKPLIIAVENSTKKAFVTTSR
jgi:hypothetical protein